ncbi:MAG: hypothetical protein ACXVCP_09875 [Bdellovibrio sp.]
MRVSIIVMLILIKGSFATAQGVKPVSVSYENLIKCFPALQDKNLSFKVDLNKLKELIDEKFVTTYSQLRQRRVTFLDNDNQDFVLTQTNKFSNNKKIQTLLSLKKLIEKGNYADIKLQENQRNNPKPDVINNILLNTNIKSDEYSYFDTKLKGVTAKYRLNFKDVQEVELADGPNKRSLFCENQQQLGIICTCTKK